ncbi:TAXI family TRAP transporter solute-binding subunit [Streptomyces sp. DSM 44915]|uniref:TAXI family TRAP transporter solute-binding subunit n=1 Tax=Streptomyces chisholmiae TaxID=3075540 RepID=A0ABU2JMM9_9ACTN|nr:TAXI family TRAP transporter solute-binding subunit [Streptomyces sp. DSM 44915]MDT0266167.1 TAXI family TRAP transporter solute-binding subunit [Streptomyces sp. DSM 44915]
MASDGPGPRRPPALAPRRRRLLAWAAVLLLALVAVVSRPLFDTTDRPSGSVTLSTGVSSGVYARYGQLLRSQLNGDAPQLEMELMQSAGSVENIERLLNGSADFAIATADSIAAYQQAGGAGAERLRACARLYDDYMHLVVPVDSPVERTADLAGLRVGVGQDQSGVQLVTRELLTAAGLDMERDVTAVRLGIDSMPRMLEAGRLDAFFWSGGLPTSAVEQLAAFTEIRLVPLGDLLPELAERGDGGYTAHYRAAVMPPDAYPGIPGTEGIDTLAVANLLLTTDSTDDRLTEQITRSVINGRDRIGREVHAAQRVDLRTAIYTQPLDLHPGARDYYRSVKS